MQVSVPLKGEVDEEEEKWRMAKGVGKNESVATTFLLHSPYGLRAGVCFYLPARGAVVAVTGHCGWCV